MFYGKGKEIMRNDNTKIIKEFNIKENRFIFEKKGRKHSIDLILLDGSKENLGDNFDSFNECKEYVKGYIELN